MEILLLNWRFIFYYAIEAFLNVICISKFLSIESQNNINVRAMDFEVMGQNWDFLSFQNCTAFYKFYSKTSILISNLNV